EEFIINHNRKSTPILTKNGSPTFLSVQSNVQITNEPNLERSSQRKDEANELKARGLTLLKTDNDRINDSLMSVDVGNLLIQQLIIHENSC
ncbi:30510_t:CDS:2, partial [Racocetra persica]